MVGHLTEKIVLQWSPRAKSPREEFPLTDKTSIATTSYWRLKTTIHSNEGAGHFVAIKVANSRIVKGNNLRKHIWD